MAYELRHTVQNALKAFSKTLTQPIQSIEKGAKSKTVMTNSRVIRVKLIVPTRAFL